MKDKDKVDIRFTLICNSCGSGLKSHWADNNKCLSVELCKTCIKEIKEEVE